MAAENMEIKNVGPMQKIPKAKYFESRNFKFFNAEVALLRLLYRSSVLFQKKTNMQLAEVYKDTKAWRNNPSPTHIVIEIVSWDMDAT